MSNQEFITKEDFDMLQKRATKDVWYNYATTVKQADNGQNVLPETHYLGNGTNIPDWSNPMLNGKVAREQMKAFKSGAINDSYKVSVDPFIGPWQKVAHEYVELQNQVLKSGSMSAFKSAGIGHTADYSAIDIVNVQQQMVNTEYRPF